MKKDAFLVTCEHGGNRVPDAYARYFAGRDALLESHEGYDAGALLLGKELAKRLDAPYVSATVTRLLVDLNRSLDHPGLHAGFIAALPEGLRKKIVERHYRPYRDEAEDRVMAAVATGHRLIHFSSHSFTPVLNGQERNADLGLLYDPARAVEAALCHAWRDALETLAPELRVRFNYPYKGTSDGLATHLRRHFDADHYAGIEIELNQRFVSSDTRAWAPLRRQIIDALARALQRLQGREG